MNKYLPHPGMRGCFAFEVYQAMAKNNKIWVITADLGYKMWDKIKEDFPGRFINCGASEQAMIGMAVGLALEGKIPIVYSITSFLLFRPFEMIRNYLNHESIPVKLIGSGRDKDYHQDGFTHWSEEDKIIMKLFNNIESHWPQTLEEIPALVKKMLKSKKPWYINLTR